MILTKDEHLVDTLGFNAPDEAFSEGIQIRRGNGSLLASDTASFEYCSELNEIDTLKEV